MADRTATFGALLRRYRETAGFSQEELAERASLTVQAIGSLERGHRRTPYPATVRSLASALSLGDAEIALLMAARGGGAAPPAVATPGAPAPLGLPRYLEPLIGRQHEREALLDLLRQPKVRLLTLTGTGGVGKTRLAIEAARQAAASFPDGIGFVPLASLTDPALVVPTIAQTLGLREAGQQTPREVLHGYLRDRQMLLILDNFEHVLGAAPEVTDLLLACPRLTVLATSRAPLRLRGERKYVVPPLNLPSSSRELPLEAMARADAVALFVRCARQVAPTFALTPANAPSIAAICRRLDGLPLAIELAAARVRLMSPAGLLERLDRTLSLLSEGARDLPKRQRTMRDALAWTYNLLAPDEQTLLRRLAVFAGGWSLESLEAVCAGDGLAPDAGLDLLSRLVEWSLIAVEGRPDDMRYALLETVRRYAAEQLEAHGEATILRERHANHFRALAEEAEPSLLLGDDTVQWLGLLEREYDNLRAALRWASEAGTTETGLRTAAALWRFWWIRGQYAEGLYWLGRLRACAAADPDAARYRGVLARATHGAALLAWSQGDHPAVAALSAESLALARETGDQRTAAWALGTLGLVAWAAQDYARARELYEESLAIFRALDDRLGIARTLNNLGEEAQARGDRARALALYEECLALDRALGNREGMAFRLHNLGQVALHQGDPERAAHLLAESLTVFRELGHRLGALMNLAALGAVACEQPGAQFARAVRLFGAATAMRDQRGIAQHPAVTESYARQVAAARAALDAPTFAATWAAGEALTPEEAIDYALHDDAAPG